MLMPRVLLVAISVATLASAQAWAEEKEKEPVAIIELGGTNSWDFGGGLSAGPSAAIEFEPIKEWLEIEVGTAPLFSSGRTQWDADVLFKKPFTLSDKLEFMVGTGPDFTYAFNGSVKVAAEVALDFMFWPTPERNYGWFIEPGYSYGGSREQSLSVTTGLLIAIR